jgi:hypothetical protein
MLCLFFDSLANVNFFLFLRKLSVNFVQFHGKFFFLLKEHERRDVAKGTAGLAKDNGGRVAGFDSKSSRSGPPRPTRHASNELIEAIDKVIEAKEEKNGRLKEVNELVQNTPEAPVEEKIDEACQQAGKADFEEKFAVTKQEDDDAENHTIVSNEDKHQKNELPNDVPSDNEHVGDASVQKADDAEQLSDDVDPREDANQLDENEVLGDAGQLADADTHVDDSHTADDSNQLAKNSNQEATATAPPFTFSDFIQPTPREGADSPNLSIASEESEALVVATDQAEDSLRSEADREADGDGQEAERKNTSAPRKEIQSKKKEKERREEEEEAKEKLQVRPQK